ncbi:MAG TPA: DUF6531 domain-containing protein [Polyangia bacterium]
MDLVLGLDIHFEIVPMLGPTPIPNPFVGVLLDKDSLLTSVATSLIEALVSGKAPKGPVLINGMPAHTVGMTAKNSMGVPHILFPPGVSWAPMPKLPRPSFKGPPPPPGPPVAPEGDAITVFGSKTVNIMGSSAVRLGDKSMSCGEPVRLPSSTVLAIPKGPPVMIGGPPALSLSDALGALLKSKWIAGYLHDLLSRMKPGRLRNLLSAVVCHLTGHPVDVASGRVLTDHTDWQLPGPLPLRFTRQYSSAWANRTGPLGHGWSHSLDQAVWPERGRIVYLDGEGRELEFDTFDFPDHVIRPGQSVWEPISRLTLKALGQQRYEITTIEGTTLEFAALPGAPAGPRQNWSRLVRQRARDGRTIAFEYDANGNLAWVKDAAGRHVGFEHDRLGRLTAMKLPHPTQAGWLPHTRFSYDARDDLVQATDPAGELWRFAYKNHLLVQETNRNGLSFFFAYDGFGEDAFCVRTWGDGGIYDHALAYEKVGKVTCVTNSLGATTTYKMNAVGCVTQVIDALGGVTAYEFDERSLWKVKETSPTGAETTWTHDARGNVVKIVTPGGAVVEIAYDQHDQPVRAVDAVKGAWEWGYDDKGHLVGRIDALSRRVQFQWDGWWLTTMIDPAGRPTRLGYDASGNITSVRTPDGAQSFWAYDNLGRCVKATNAAGAEQTREHDALGRVVLVRGPDGNVRALAYDPEGNVTRARDEQHDVRFSYQGMGRLSSRSEAGTTVGFSYDTEEQLRAITNEHGSVYRFELGLTGNVDVEHGFDGIRRQYRRDKAGRVVKVFRPAGRESDYSYDDGGRVAAVKHSDGSAEAFAYRIDGEMLEAVNGAATVAFARDVLGRIEREIVGDDWVASEYDALGARVRLQSSRGLDQRIKRDSVGRARGIQATVGGDGSSAWEAKFQRDALGLEVDRKLPGGVRSRWERDKTGRPLKHEVTGAGGFRRAVQYTWEANDQLRAVIDAQRGPTRYEHDALGNLAAAVYADGRVDLRLPDAVGNLFRTQDRGDRKYGPTGQLLEARGADGGVTKYSYDAEGNLIAKVQPDGGTWSYAWNGAGMLAAVTRPDGAVVTFAYDALGRRVKKTFRGCTTRWIWDGNVPLHEWVEAAEGVGDDAQAAGVDAIVGDEIAARRRAAQLNERPAQGPPAAGIVSTSVAQNRAAAAINAAAEGAAAAAGAVDGVCGESEAVAAGTAAAPITWIFDPESFAPAAKLLGAARYSILTDHLGTPTTMLDGGGSAVWSAEIDIYGALRNVEGVREACPFRWPGQYEDAETGLYYNRFRYYDPEAGEYASQDPIGILGGWRPFAYVADPLTWSDAAGLSGTCGIGNQESVPISRENARRLLQERGLSPAQAAELVNSFDGQILAGKGHAGDIFVITESKFGSASGVFVTRDFAGETSADRIRALALPPSNTAKAERLVELTRDQTLLEGRVAAQPQWGADRTGVGWQTVTDGGRYTGAVK